MGLLRPIILIVGAMLLLPSPPEQRWPVPSRVAAEDDASVPEMVGAAFRAIGDVGSFCARQETVCDTAGRILTSMEAKAKYNIELLYQWARSDVGGSSTSPLKHQASADPVVTGATSLLAAAPASSQNTLTPQDLVIP